MVVYKIPQNIRKGSRENILAFWVRTSLGLGIFRTLLSIHKNEHLIRSEYHSMVGQDFDAFKQGPIMKMHPCPLRVNLGCSREVKFRGHSSAVEHTTVLRVLLLLSSA